MIDLKDFTKNFPASFSMDGKLPWEILNNIETLLNEQLTLLSTDYIIVKGNIAIHKSARIEDHSILKGPVVISEKCFIASHAYLRGGVLLGPGVVIGPGCEIKSSIILSGSALAHFNFAGDSIIGSNVNMEAGAVIANHYNERTDKMIYVSVGGKQLPANTKKFGALVGDGCRIGANAVLSPGTILVPDTIVKRLELVEQCPEH